MRRLQGNRVSIRPPDERQLELSADCLTKESYPAATVALFPLLPSHALSALPTITGCGRGNGGLTRTSSPSQRSSNARIARTHHPSSAVARSAADSPETVRDDGAAGPRTTPLPSNRAGPSIPARFPARPSRTDPRVCDTTGDHADASSDDTSSLLVCRSAVSCRSAAC